MDFDPSQIELAAARLREGGLVAFPTETVYGLGADALNEAAVRRVFEAKGRPPHNPLIVHVTGIEMAAGLVDGPLSDSAVALMRTFWPGPLSIVLPKHPRIPGIVTGGAGSDSVALRCPDHPIALALLFAFGGALVGPSANRSGGVSPTTAEHVRAEFDSSTAMVLDGGNCQTGIESTVISLHDTGAAEGGATILRPGIIGAEQLATVLDMPVGFSPGMPDARGDAMRNGAAAPLHSPGLLASHYAPRARTVLFSDWQELEELADDAAAPAAGPASLAVLSHSLLAEESELPPGARLLRLPAAPHDYAAALYRTLREADTPETAVIAVHRPPPPHPPFTTTPEEAAVWRAVHDRLARACAPRGH
ncbi:MAG TPA: L-threonylcarbamoyladenylate synthase [Phycisphaerales bacterium]|nr:L-threonylcarbamoyladenylate synthase [Phycisphaerales bacterium]